jgi:hypothetical protein
MPDPATITDAIEQTAKAAVESVTVDGMTNALRKRINSAVVFRPNGPTVLRRTVGPFGRRNASRQPANHGVAMAKRPAVGRKQAVCNRIVVQQIRFKDVSFVLAAVRNLSLRQRPRASYSSYVPAIAKQSIAKPHTISVAP